MKNRAVVDDADVDAFIARFITKLNPALSAEERADAIHDFTLTFVEFLQPETTKEWASELARKVRSRVLWLK